MYLQTVQSIYDDPDEYKEVWDSCVSALAALDAGGVLDKLSVDSRMKDKRAEFARGLNKMSERRFTRPSGSGASIAIGWDDADLSG